jgi:hypothetical protein
MSLSMPTTVNPLRVKIFTAAVPMNPAAPVTTATLVLSPPLECSHDSLRGDRSTCGRPGDSGPGMATVSPEASTCSFR